MTFFSPRNFQPASKSNVVAILEKARASLPEPVKAPSKAAAAAKPAASKAQAVSSATSGGSAGSTSASSSGGNANKRTKPGAKQTESKVSLWKFSTNFKLPAE